jgi:SCP-2 sterol transfer family
MEEQRQQTKTPAQPRATARRVPGLEGTTGKLRVEIEGKGAPRFFSVHDGLIEEVPGDGQVDAGIVFDDESCVQQLLSGKLNPIVAGLQGRLRTTGDLKLIARVIFELQGQAGGFGRSMIGEA